VFDIDGVLADVSARLHHLATRPKAWEAFFAAATDDPPLAPGIELARTYAQGHDLAYLTGRPERTRALTEAWLDRHRLPAGTVYMRPDRDHRAARLFKVEMLRTLARQRTITVVVDDDPAVIDAVNAAGFPGMLAEWLPYTRVLAEAQERDGRT
jgi:hypothetical protein